MSFNIKTSVTTPPRAEGFGRVDGSGEDPNFSDVLIVGSYIYYIVDRANTTRFYRMNLDGTNITSLGFITVATTSPVAHTRLAHYDGTIYVLRSTMLGAYWQLYLTIYNIDTTATTSEQLTGHMLLPKGVDLAVDSTGVYIGYTVYQNESYVGKCALDGTGFVSQLLGSSTISTAFANSLNIDIDDTYAYMGYTGTSSVPKIAKVLKSDITTYTVSNVATPYSPAGCSSYLVGDNLYFITANNITNYEQVNLTITDKSNVQQSTQTLYTATSTWQSIDGSAVGDDFYYCLRDTSALEFVTGSIIGGVNTAEVLDIENISYTDVDAAGPIRVSKSSNAHAIIYEGRDNAFTRYITFMWRGEQPGEIITKYNRI